MTEHYLKEFKNYLENNHLSPDAIRNYLWSLKKYGERELNTNEIINFLKESLNKYQPSSLRNLRNGLKSFSRFQKIDIEWEITKKIIPTIQPKFFTTINQKELELLKQSPTKTSEEINNRNNLLLDFLFYTGLRINELVNIKHSDYCQGSLKIHGKGNKVRFIFIPDFLTKYFNGSSDYLFKTRKEKKLTTTQARMIIYRKTKKSGINKKISPHTFRRSFATLLNNKNVRLTTIQKLLGHSQINTTANYIHNSHEELYKDYSKVFW
ncbi:tyrosine-type recombinase/integrase [endosymbiont GvMRE of Glomus versiforme]|uniref:tyrosine-type recombinase/integrase n=1 Tax=endosymbiont GvMRE of Glomus versiforme TaxID=2039283 RepID=UPI0015583FCF|nr:tyrosine-type recombinase/integrase [endosymbiont GvMRE of Glomus versiforme]